MKKAKITRAERHPTNVLAWVQVGTHSVDVSIPAEIADALTPQELRALIARIARQKVNADHTAPDLVGDLDD